MKSSSSRTVAWTKSAGRALVVDFGGTYGDQTARAIFSLGYPVSLVPNSARLRIALNDIMRSSSQSRFLLVLPGCDLSVDPEFDMTVLEMGLPSLGICNGFQILARSVGGTVDAIPREAGKVRFEMANKVDSDLFDGLPRSFEVVMNHRCAVVALPSTKCESLGNTPSSPIAAMSCNGGQLIGFQFHPESRNATHGSDLLGRILEKHLGKASRCRFECSRALLSVVDALNSWVRRISTQLERDGSATIPCASG